ncbi:MAG: DUF799 family lipoprotein [Smithella sp.]|nr:hypothetical protein KD27_05545 [Smithella sp. D17]MDD5343575.1 DUF799 family lipoprotein [Smithella sp.]MDD5524342.1 DUF799 family lipoprotein [Smithella sp.]
MKIFKIYLYTIIIGSLTISGCSTNSPYGLKPNYDQNSAKIIALLPVENKTLDDKTSQLFRSRLFEELYFKGYSKLPLDVIDKKLEYLYLEKKSKKSAAIIIDPQLLKDLVGADAGMYCTLNEENESKKIFYSSRTIAVRCELRSTQTGEVLWNAEGKSTSRNFDLTHKGLERKSKETYETVIEEVVNKVIKTLPDGPNLRG